MADRPIRCTSRPAAALSRSSVSARCAPRLVDGDRVDLVDDAPAGLREQVLGPAGEHQVQRLGCRDQDVRRPAQHRRALALGRVAGTDRDAQVGSDPAQRHPQVALDVVGERLERRDIHQADPCRGGLAVASPARFARSPGSARSPRFARCIGSARPISPAPTVLTFGGERVDRPQERGERLARAGRGADQDVLAGGDRRPRLRLGGCRRSECGPEPVARSGAEGGEGLVERHDSRA